MDGIANRDKPQIPAQNLVSHAPDSDRPGYRKSQGQVRSQISGPNPARRRNEGGKNSPRQALREKQSQVGKRPAQPHRAGPAQLMIPEPTKGLYRIHGPNGCMRQNDFPACFGDTQTEFVVIRQRVGDGLKTSHFRNPFFRGGNGGSQSETDALLPARHEYAGKKIAGGANGFQLCAKIFFGNRAIERSNGTYF